MGRKTCRNCGEPIPKENKSFCGLECQKNFKPKRFRRPCRICEEMFEPKTKNGKLCQTCKDKRKKGAAFKIRKENRK